MILLTGGTGFIGSNLHAALHERAAEVVILDWLGDAGKWRNLAKHPPSRVIAPEQLDEFLATHPPLELVVHLGAISETTAEDGDVVWRTNVEMSQRLLHWCIDHQVRLIYASSAATYGSGSAGFDDDSSPSALALLQPLNLYGWSKQAFDLYVARCHAAGMRLPPQCVGLKFFNVYGPNEYHKGRMISVVKVKYDEISAGQRPRLFRSNQPGLADGAQRRDFIWVGDVVDVLLWLIDTPAVSGLFNVGTGIARTYLDLAHAVCRAAGVTPDAEFIDMPPEIQGSYQSFTEARIDRLRKAGYGGQFTPLEDGINRYVKDYLSQPDPYR